MGVEGENRDSLALVKKFDFLRCLVSNILTSRNAKKMFPLVREGDFVFQLQIDQIGVNITLKM